MGQDGNFLKNWEYNSKIYNNVLEVGCGTTTEFAKELKNLLASQNEEWKWIADSLFVPMCEIYKYMNSSLVFCPEAQCCGRHKKLTDIKEITFNESNK